ncbi:MAG: CHAT domain-containing protein [Bacteroidetes bacterium]|nr:CHAT domain-containing protein [Bacteroidota bacterium]
MNRFSIPALFCIFLPVFAFSQQQDSLAAAREVDSLVSLCRSLASNAQDEEALQAIESAEKKALSVFGKENAAYATCLFYHGRVFYYMGKLGEAEARHLQAKDIRAKVLGTAHPDYASSLNSLAMLCRAKGDFDQSEALHLQAKDIREKTMGTAHPDYAASLNNLASVYMDKGYYDKAEAMYLEAKGIREKVLGKENLQYAASLNNLAILYEDKGDYGKAEPLYLEAMDIRLKIRGAAHPDYAESLNNLAVFYRKKGDYDKAEAMYLEAKDIQSKTLGTSNPDYAQSLNNLAVLYHAKGEYGKAEPLYLEAKNIREKVFGTSHPYYATSLNNLANLYKDKGEYGKAEPLYLEAKNIREKVFGTGHNDYAASLNDLATLYHLKGEYAKAEPLYLEANSIWAKVMGTDHPNYAGSLFNLATLYWAKGSPGQAERYFMQASACAKNLLQKATAYSSENEMLHYGTLLQENFEALLSFAQTHPSDSLLAAAYDNALSLNNALLDAALAREKGIARADSSTRALHTEWKSLLFRLAKQYALPVAERQNLPELEEKANAFEKELVRRSPAFAEARRQTHWQEVQSNLREGEAAIEFVRYRYHNSKKVTDTIRYAALVLLPGAAPRYVPLCGQRMLDALFQQRKPDEFHLQDLYAPRRHDGLPTLHALLWQPLEPLLQGVKTVYFAPAGDLHRLHLAALCPKNYGHPLSEQYRLVQVGSTRVLAQPMQPALLGAGEAVLFGNIQYGPDILQFASSAVEEDASNELTTRSDKTTAWNFLPGSKPEIDSVGAALAGAGFKVALREGSAATEEVFRQMGETSPSPRILHLSTHGFFFPDPNSELRGETVRSEIPEAGFKISENPMTRAGLVFAGANHAWKTGKPVAGMEDGILTAYEVSRMNLQNTDLVVLSACETGLGFIQGNEGVFGLQRAFQLAGAKNLVMTLWSVPDGPTRLLMTRFYQNWLEKKTSVREALEEAQAWMRGQETYQSPYFWAGFVLLEF